MPQVNSLRVSVRVPVRVRVRVMVRLTCRRRTAITHQVHGVSSSKAECMVESAM
jgi:hypothetical protein